MKSKKRVSKKKKPQQIFVKVRNGHKYKTPTGIALNKNGKPIVGFKILD